MWNIPTKGSVYHSLGLKTVCYISISWEPSFNKIRNILTDISHGKCKKHRNFLRTRYHAHFRGCSVIHRSKTFFSSVGILPAQQWKCCGDTLIFHVQNNRKYRKHWWLGNCKLSIACGFHILGTFKASNLENDHCCQSWLQTQSIWCKWRYSDFNVCTHCLSHIAS